MGMKIFNIFLIILIQIHSTIYALDFGVCEVIIPQLVHTNLSTPYWINKSIQGCCKGFIKIGDKCEPDCRKVECINSYCVGNNTCQCNVGYYSISEYKCIPKCDPACSADMECSEPNHCTCKRDYKAFNNTHCEPICSFTEEDFDCINARCYAPNKCKCLEGFNAVSDFQCEPICENCEDGVCVSPGYCECNDGYEKNFDGTCKPQCTPNCINADCIKPNVCRCHESYQKYLIPHECFDANTFKDRQDCRRTCTNGSCSRNGTCLCDYGYEMYNGKCLKICTKKCTNGKCLENQCICPTDYKLSATDNSTCMPICSFEDGHDCINGDCIAPNICECYPGYKFLDNRNCTCVPMCNPPCINGYCTEDGCICHDNFYNISDYECIKNCSEGYMWLVDECVENFDFDNFGEVTETTVVDTTMTSVDTKITNVETKEYVETSTERELEAVTETTMSEDTTRYLLVEKSDEPKLLTSKFLIVVLSVVTFLLICILITFFILYNFIFPKNIYFVQDKEQSENCVYFTQKPVRQTSMPITEFNI